MSEQAWYKMDTKEKIVMSHHIRETRADFADKFSFCQILRLILTHYVTQLKFRQRTCVLAVVSLLRLCSFGGLIRAGHTRR